MAVKSFAELAKFNKAFVPSEQPKVVTQASENIFLVPFGHEAYEWLWDNVECTNFTSFRQTLNAKDDKHFGHFHWLGEVWKVTFKNPNDAFRFKLTFDGL
jgi:hypothetical protein